MSEFISQKAKQDAFRNLRTDTT